MVKSIVIEKDIPYSWQS